MIDPTKLAMWEYQTPDTIMVPYERKFFPPRFLFDTFDRLVAQGLVNLIFPGMGIEHVHQFIRFIDTHPSVMCFVREDGGEPRDLAGLGYITETDGVDGARKAAFGFGFFREYHATKAARILSWFMLSFWLHNLSIDVLFGTTLRANRLARNFSYNFGFKGHHDIPKLFFRNGELQDGTIMLLERIDFDPLYEAFREEYVPTMVGA